MITNTYDLERLKDIGSKIEDKSFVEDSDVLLVHGLVAADVSSDFDCATALINHGGSRRHTIAFKEHLDAADPLERWSLDKEVEEIRREIKNILEKPDVVTSESKYVSDKMKQFYGVETEVLRSPIDRERFKPTDSEGDYFFSACRMTWEKRVHKQIEAFKDLDEKLVIAGKGEHENIVKFHADKYDNIEYIGYADREEMTDLYSGAKAFIHTGIKDEYSMSVRESLACGTPVIAEDRGGTKEILHSDELGVLIPPDNVVRGLKIAVQNFDRDDYDENVLRKETERYAPEKVYEDVQRIAEKAYKNYQGSR